MTPGENPFTPGFAQALPVLAGRADLLGLAATALASGPRHVAFTSLLPRQPVAPTPRAARWRGSGPQSPAFRRPSRCQRLDHSTFAHVNLGYVVP